MGDFDSTLGYTLLGVMINTYLAGIITSQFFTYWNAKYMDPWWTRALIVCLFVVNASQVASVVYMSWFYCVANFANPQSITIVPWPYPYTALTNTVLALVFQMFQSWRIYMFNKSKILVGFILAAALAAFGAGSAVALQALTQVHQLAGFTVLQPVIEANNVLQCAVDVSIAIILSTMFSGLKMNGTRRTDKILNRLIRTAIRSGFFTGIFALGILFSFHFLPNTYMVGLFFLPIGRIYTHTMMDHFVGREELCNMFFDGVSVPTFNIVVSVPTFNVVATGGMEAVMMLGNTSSTPSKDPEANGTT